MTKKKKTLVILSPAFPGDERETTWVISQQLLVKALRENFPELPIVVLAFLYPYHAATYQWKGVKVISFGGMQERKYRRLLLWKKVWRTLKDIHKENGIGGIFSFWCGECALIGTYFGKLHRIRHYCWLCGQDTRASNKMVRLIRPDPDELVAMSYFLADGFYKNHGIQPQHLIPNAIDPSLFLSVDGAERDIDLLGVGSLIVAKRYDLFVNVIASLQVHIPSLCALHCGGGPEKPMMESLIKKHGLENVISFLGEQSHEKILQLMQHTKVLLHPSEYEGYSTVCLEALYAGAHVISFCDPMEKQIPHWHVVHNVDEMIRCALEILLQPAADHTPVLLHTMDDSAKAVMRLFADQFPNTGNRTEG